MKTFFVLISLVFTGSVWAQSAVVDISLTPAGSFKIKSSEVHGFVTKNGKSFEAKNITVGLKNLTTGVSLRDVHTKKHLEVDKYPNATLVSAKGSDGKGTGILRVRTVEKPIQGTYKVEGSKLTAEFPIKLSEFKFTDIKYMGVGVDDDAKITVTVPIKK